jgi:NSS family neurotransmitter:Na+ symporter
MGAMVTYGSYLSRGANLRFSGMSVAAFDTGIAMMAGFMIFPAVFAMGKDPAQGPTLIFVVLPEVFNQMPLGGLVGVVFFVLLSIAALTSTVSLLEVVVAYAIDERRWSRAKSVWVIGGITFIVGLPSALSAGVIDKLTNFQLFGQVGYLSIMDYLWGNLSLAIGALLLSVFVGWVWGIPKAGAEMQQGGRMSDRAVGVWGIFVRWICPVVISIVLLWKLWQGLQGFFAA